MSAFVLAGGASTRMGTDKALINLNGIPFIAHAVQLLAGCGLTPRIVTAGSRLDRFAPVVEDRQTGCGPLSGIEAGLLASESALSLFIPVDMPLLPASLIHLLLTRAARTGALATLPRTLGIAQPLCAVYHRTLLPGISQALADGDYKVMRVIEKAAAHLGGDRDIFDIETVLAAGGSFADWPAISSHAMANCNTPAELERIYLYATAFKAAESHPHRIQ